MTLLIFHENKLHYDSFLTYFEKLNRSHSNCLNLIVKMRILFSKNNFVFGRALLIAHIVTQLHTLDSGLMVIHFQIFTLQSLIPNTMPARSWTFYSHPSKYIGISSKIQMLYRNRTNQCDCVASLQQTINTLYFPIWSKELFYYL